VNSMDERGSTEMTPLLRRIDTGMDGEGGGESETMIMGMSASPCIVLIAMSIEVAEIRCLSGGVERGSSDKVGGVPSWVVCVCKWEMTGAGERVDRSVQFAALHNG
jgi:hypothetical protein